jgi:hypothetical protein
MKHFRLWFSLHKNQLGRTKEKGQQRKVRVSLMRELGEKKEIQKRSWKNDTGESKNDDM